MPKSHWIVGVKRSKKRVVFWSQKSLLTHPPLKAGNKMKNIWAQNGSFWVVICQGSGAPFGGAKRVTVRSEKGHFVGASRPLWRSIAHETARCEERFCAHDWSPFSDPCIHVVCKFSRLVSISKPHFLGSKTCRQIQRIFETQSTLVSAISGAHFWEIPKVPLSERILTR